MAAPDLLLRLLTTPGPSGAEAAPAAVWREAAAAFADVREDALGSSIARVAAADDEAPLLALFGHIDEIGVVVTHADDEGFLHFRGLGGWDPQVLLGQRVEILARDGVVPGVVARSRDLEKDTRVELKHLYLDLGARDRDDALRLVRIGDPAVLASTPTELANGRLASRALDNRLGAYVVLEVARRLAETGPPPLAVAAVASVSEEVGDFLGARTGAFALRPDVAVAVDVTFATDVPGARPAEAGKIDLGGGTVASRGPGLSPRLFELLRETAEEEGIPCATEVSVGASGTDADAVVTSREGVPSAVVSIPIRHFHTPVETVDLADLEATIRLLVAFVPRLALSLRA